MTRRQSRRPQAPSLLKEQLDSHPPTKLLLFIPAQESTSETPATQWNKKIWGESHKNGRKNVLLPASSHPTSQHLSVPRGNSSARKNSPHQERESRMSNQLPQPFVTLYKEPDSVSPHSETHEAKIYRESPEQGRRAGYTNMSTQWKSPQFPLKRFIDDPSSFHHWRNQQPAQLHWAPCRFH